MKRAGALRVEPLGKPTPATAELRDAEERIRSVVDHVVDGIITIDDRGCLESFTSVRNAEPCAASEWLPG